AADALGAGGSTGFTPDGVAQDLTADSEDTAQGSANSIRPEDSEQSAAATSSNSAGTSGGTTENVGINGSTVALPFGLDPSTTPVLGSFGAT
ncbi:arabinosyltransferase C-terminal domain-containing protein, partial [Klebsiella pneumoniae]|nr:arabinosyltransferase C-terminal domain-containing protein [Klebsiella pneumoniae]